MMVYKDNDGYTVYDGTMISKDYVINDKPYRSTFLMVYYGRKVITRITYKSNATRLMTARARSYDEALRRAMVQIRIHKLQRRDDGKE